MSENQSNLSIDKRANQSLILRWEPKRAQHWDEKSSEFSMKGEKFSLRINLSSVLWWDLWLCVAKPQWIFTLLLVFATISRHCPGSRHKTWDQRQDSSISVLLSSFFSITDSLLCKSWENETNTFFCFITFQRMIFTRTPFPFCDH